MKNFKNIFALLVAVVMVMGMTVIAFADTSDYTITVNGAIKDAKYVAYKVFDVTYDATDTSKVNYTIISGHDVSKIDTFSTVFKTVGDGTKYVERASDSVTDDQIIKWLKENETQIKNTCEKTVEVENTNGTDSVLLDVKSAGYYFIASSLGDKSAVTIDTAHPAATVNSKINNGPTPPDDNDAKKIKINEKEVSVADLEPGTVVNFEVKFNATNYAVDESGNQTIIYNYIVKDAPDGFSIINTTENPVTVSLDGSQTLTTKATVDIASDGKMTVTIPWGTKEVKDEKGNVTTAAAAATYNNPTVVTITYKATLNAVTKAKNKATVTYNDTQKVTEDENEVYNYTVDVDKYDAADVEGTPKDESDDAETTKDYSSVTKLPGAQFAIKNKENKYYKLTETTTGEGDGAVTTYKVEWVELAQATTYWTSKEGTNEGTTYQQVVFKGLQSGRYTLVELTAPKGYNLAADTDFTLNAISEKVTDTSTLTVTYNVEDVKGTALPSTGGIGTTIFYIIGSILVIGAGVVLVSKRRMNAR